MYREGNAFSSQMLRSINIRKSVRQSYCNVLSSIDEKTLQ